MYLTPSAFLDLVACLSHLVIAVLALISIRNSRLALLVGLISLSFFGWNFGSFGFKISGHIGWHWFDQAASPPSSALALHIVLAYAGSARKYRPFLIASYSLAALLIAAALLSALFPWTIPPTDRPAWSVVYLCHIGFALLTGRHALLAHQRTAIGIEHLRSRVLLIAILVGGTVSSLGRWRQLGVPVPPIGSLGALAGTLLLLLATTRMQLFDVRIPVRLFVKATLTATTAVAACLAAFQWLEERVALFAVAATAIVVAAILGVHARLATVSARKNRLSSLAVLGKFSAQMAHDLRNPLAALKGAVQFLQVQVDTEPTQPLASQREFLQLVARQVDRIQGAIDDYQRIARVEPRPRPTDLNLLVQEVLSLHQFTVAGVRVVQDLAAALPMVHCDRALIASVLENLVRNAFEAMPQGGEVHVATQLDGRDHRGGMARLTVRDTGVGMNPRVLERAFDDFFTTKASGSGLGLSWVHRAVTQHGGKVELRSAPGRGTTVAVRLPIVADETAPTGV